MYLLDVFQCSMNTDEILRFLSGSLFAASKTDSWPLYIVGVTKTIIKSGEDKITEVLYICGEINIPPHVRRAHVYRSLPYASP